MVPFFPLCPYIVGEEQGVKKLSGTIQNDIQIIMVRNTYIYPQLLLCGRTYAYG